jgi:glycine reductase
MGADRTPTWVYQNHPVVGELFRRHGRDLVFAGVVITKCLSSAFFDKQRSASYAAKLARLLGADGVVITGGCGGHGIADLMLNCREAERQGLHTALTCFEMAGDRGNEFGFVTFVPEADAVVSTGNMDEIVEFPEMDRVIGGQEIVDIGNYEGDGGSPAVGPFKAALRRLYAASSMGGAGRMTARPA